MKNTIKIAARQIPRAKKILIAGLPSASERWKHPDENKSKSEKTQLQFLKILLALLTTWFNPRIE